VTIGPRSANSAPIASYGELATARMAEPAVLRLLRRAPRHHARRRQPCLWSAKSGSDAGDPAKEMGGSMIILGIILLVIGFVIKVAFLWTIGVILLLIGVILALLGAAGRMVGPRRHYW
jgi:hypothetical protein